MESACAGSVALLCWFCADDIVGHATATAAEFTAAQIKKYSIKFRPGKELNKAVATVDYQKDESSQ